jgi:hypothetical protein
MRFRPANISLINRRLYLPQLRLTLSLKYDDKNYPTDSQILTGHSISASEGAQECERSSQGWRAAYAEYPNDQKDEDYGCV